MNSIEQFVGKSFIETKADGLTQYMEIRGMPWLIRKLVCRNMNKGYFRLNHDEVEGVYSIELGLTKDRKKYLFRLGEAFEDIAYDGNKHRIIFTFEDGVLVETHTLLNPKKDSARDDDIFRWELQSENELVSKSIATKNTQEATWTRYFIAE
uniref:DUF4178 domain-containing protein n=1 Tax=Rhabditophanes sp. KR3021 TaxID=114890 RepID=A0AC35TXQ9_9BILA